MTDEDDVVGYVPACPDCGAVGEPESEKSAQQLADLHNDEKGRNATVSPVTEEDERVRAEVLGDD